MNGHQSQGRGPRPPAERRRPGSADRATASPGRRTGPRPCRASACSGPTPAADARPAGILPRVDARILLVEDDPSIREITTIGLRNAGFEVDAAADGQAGLERFRAEPYDLILLDVMLPRLDGLEVCRAIRRVSTVPVVMLTARADTIDVVVGLEAGADDYVKKPFEVPELVARVRAAIRRAGREVGDPDALRLGTVAIDLAGRTATKDGREVAAHQDRVRPPRRARPAPRPRPEPRRPARPDLGLRLPGRFAARRRRDPATPGEDRGRSGRAGADPDRPRRRVQGGSLRPWPSRGASAAG